MSADQPPRTFIGPRPVPPAAGIGLRAGHLGRIIEERPQVAWFEIDAAGPFGAEPSRGELLRVAAHYPLSLRAPGLALACSSLAEDPRLERLREMVLALQPGLISEALSWSACGHAAEVFPYTGRALGVVIGNIHRVQETLQRRLLLETPLRTSPVLQSTWSAEDFLSEVLLRTGCGLSLDLDGMWQSAADGDRSPLSTLHGLLDAVSSDDVAEIHVPAHALPSAAGSPAGGTASGPEIRELLEAVVARRGPVPTVVEGTDDAPEFEVLLAQAAAVQSTLSRHAPNPHRAQAC
jgi:uncharacterized protein